MKVFYIVTLAYILPQSKITRVNNILPQIDGMELNGIKMKLNIIKLLIVNTALIISSFANASLIINTDRDSFIDTSSGLEWMDFGINNNESYDYVAGQLDAGEKYYGWMLATEMQVIDLYDHLFIGMGGSAEPARSQNYNLRHATAGSNIVGNSGLLPFNWDVIGHVNALSVGTRSERTHTIGQTINDEGRVVGLILKEYADLNGYTATEDDRATLVVYDNVFTPQMRATAHSLVSTMLVRATPVPEPASLVIFALGIMVLGLRRKNRV
jgi:hypothetical protein